MDYKDYLSGQNQYNFWTRARKELISRIVSKYHGLKGKLKILNIGAGIGDNLEELGKYGDNYVIDIDSKALDLIPDDLVREKSLANAVKIPYSEDFFDMIVCFDVLEHIKADFKVVREIRRVLKKDCPVIFSVPAFPFLFSSHDRALQHKRRYYKHQLDDLFSKFRKKNFFYWNFILFIPLALMRLLRKKNKNKEDLVEFPRYLNDLLFQVLKLENSMISHRFWTPFGLSIIGICLK